MPEYPLKIETRVLRLKRAFRLAKATATEKLTIIARYGDGIGEGSPSILYGLPADEIVAQLRQLPSLQGEVIDASVLKDAIQSLPRSLNPGRCALEMALLDHHAQRDQVPLHTFLKLEKPGALVSSLTITHGTDKEIDDQLEIAEAFDSLKLKVGFDRDLDFVDYVLKRKECRLRLDANGGWSTEETIERVKLLSGYPIEFIEQPLTDPRLRDLDRIKTKAECTIILDESIITADDVSRFSPVVDGVNLKLSKCGGILTTVAMAEAARQRNLKLLLGCMLETAVGITAALHLASLFDYFDLDSLLLTENDPYWGAHFEGQMLLLPGGNGIGVMREADALA